MDKDPYGSGEFPLETSRLLIRLFTVEDLEAFHAIFSSPLTMRFIPSGASSSLEASRGRLERIIKQHVTSSLSLWAVVEKASGQVVGDCGLFPLEGRGPDVEAAYHFMPVAWGKGYATEAAVACICYGFTRLGLGSMLALVLPENQASVRVLEKAGLLYKRRGFYYHLDVDVYATGAGTWQPGETGRIGEL